MAKNQTKELENALRTRSLPENSKGSRAWGLHGERKARGGGDVHVNRRRRATQRSSSNPHAPFGFRLGRGICFVGAPRRCAPTSPASRRLASAPSKPGTRPLPILGQAPNAWIHPILLMLRHARIYFWKSSSYRCCLYWPLFRSIIEVSRLLQIQRFRRNLPGLGEMSTPFTISSVSAGDNPSRVAALASNRKFPKAPPTDGRAGH